MSLAELAKQLKLEASYDKTKAIFTRLGPMCRKCWNHGRALTPECCICTGDVQLDKVIFTQPVNQPIKPKKKNDNQRRSTGG